MIKMLFPVVTLVMSLVALAFAYVVGKRNERRSIELLKRLGEVQDWEGHNKRQDEAIAENNKQQTQVEQDLRDGKKDYFDNDGDWDRGLRK